MSKYDPLTADMIAPCGLDCSLCKRALAETNPCPGCHGPNEKKPEFCAERCGIILCRKRMDNAYKYCDEFPDYPCADVVEKEIRYTSKYLCYVRDHPIQWRVPTNILYGRKDSLTSFETVCAFAEKHNAALTVMENGEHWFHTDEQMQFLDDWIRKSEV